MTTAFLVLCLLGSSFWAEELRARAVFTDAAHLPSVVNAEAASLAVLLDARTVLVNIVHSILRGIIILSTISKIGVEEPPEVHTARTNTQQETTPEVHEKRTNPQKYNEFPEVQKKRQKPPRSTIFSITSVLIQKKAKCLMT